MTSWGLELRGDYLQTCGNRYLIIRVSGYKILNYGAWRLDIPLSLQFCAAISRRASGITPDSFIRHFTCFSL